MVGLEALDTRHATHRARGIQPKAGIGCRHLINVHFAATRNHHPGERCIWLVGYEELAGSAHAISNEIGSHLYSC